MANTPVIGQTSAQAGFLPPGPGLFRFQFDVPGYGLDIGYSDGSTPNEGQTLDNFIQQLVAGICQLPPNMVYPRWQPEPPILPPNTVNWAAVGVTDSELLHGWGVIMHDPANGGRDIMEQYEEFTVLCSFYGPNADLFDALLRDGLQIPQNREILQLNAIGIVNYYSRTVVPELIKNTWLRRVDRQIKFTRAVLREYPVLNFLGVQFTVDAQNSGGTIISNSETVDVPGP